MAEAIYDIASGVTSYLPITSSSLCLGSQEVHLTKEYAENVYVDKIKMNLIPPIKDALFKDPATIVFFEDGTKTVVKTMEGQEFDPDYGFLLCIMKRAYGEDFHKLMWKYCWGGQEARRAHRKKYKLANKAKDGKDDETSTTR